MDGGSSELSDDWTFVGLESLRRCVAPTVSIHMSTIVLQTGRVE
jgi:hypothetical protein